jgi:hypothetical protein
MVTYCGTPACTPRRGSRLYRVTKLLAFPIPRRIRPISIHHPQHRLHSDWIGRVDADPLGGPAIMLCHPQDKPVALPPSSLKSPRS